MHFLYVSDTRDHGYGVCSHVEDLIAASLHLPFQARHRFVPRRCLMTEVSLRPNCQVSSAPLPVFFPHLSYVGRPCGRDIIAARSDKFLWAWGPDSASLTAICYSISSQIVPEKLQHVHFTPVICDRGGPFFFFFEFGVYCPLHLATRHHSTTTANYYQ